jgi:hypothetical protein
LIQIIGRGVERVVETEKGERERERECVRECQRKKQREAEAERWGRNYILLSSGVVVLFNKGT